MNRGWVWAIIGVVIGGAIGAFAFRQDPVRARRAEQPPAVTAPQAAETPEERELRHLSIAIRGAGGEIASAVLAESGWELGVELPRRTVRLEAVERDALRLFREIKRTGAPVAGIVLVTRTDELKDVYGHPLKNVAIARIRLSGATFERINWDGFEPKNFARVADELWLHDELQAQAAERMAQEAKGQGGSSQGGEEQSGGAGSSSS